MKWAWHFGTVLLGLAPLFQGCRCNSDETSEVLEADPAPELPFEAREEDPLPRSERCSLDEEAKFVLVADSDEELELDVVKSTPGGFAVGGVRHRSATHPFVFWVSGKETREVSLPELHGAGGPPEVIPIGNSLLVLLEESDARGGFLQIYRILPDLGAKLEKGPSLGLDQRPFESSAIASSGATAFAVWDSRASSGRSTVFAQVLDALTLKPLHPSSRLTAPSDDTGAPRVLARPGGYFVFWTRYGEVDPKSQQLEELIPSQLFVATLDESGHAHGQPLALSGEVSELEFDARVLGEELWVLLRLPANKVELVKVASSGSLEVHPIVAPKLGSEPVLMAEAQPYIVVVGESERGEPLLALGKSAAGLELAPEALLDGRDVLGSSPLGLVTAIDTELGVVLQGMRCEPKKGMLGETGQNPSGGGNAL